MKGFTEMTDQEILALTEEDVQKLIKLRMMEEGIKIMDKPKIPELFEIEPADFSTSQFRFWMILRLLTLMKRLRLLKF